MKRKLNEEDVPIPVEAVGETSSAPPPVGFDGLGLDTRLLQAIAKEGFSRPFGVQEQAIPLILEGKHVLVHARTGSGKTAAYLLPVLQAILQRKSVSPRSKAISALILVPTRELADQVTKVITSFTTFCNKDIRTVNLTLKTGDAVQRSFLADSPEIVVSTPAGAKVHLDNGALGLTELSHVVLDEADLLLSYGYEEDLKHVSQLLPSNVQKIMMSASLGDDTETVKKLFCQDLVILEPDDAPGEEPKLNQFYMKSGEDEKFLRLCVMYKYSLVKGKSIIFVDNTDRCYRLKLFLEQFGIKSCILNSELPINSRIHVVEEFNKNVYDIIIASDEHEVLGSESRKLKKSNNAANGDGTKDNSTEAPAQRRKSSQRARSDKEYGVSRGIDFKNVAFVLNFDLPQSFRSYIHRVGRTARAGRSGMAMSLVIPRAQHRKNKHTTIASTEHDEEIIADIIESQAKRGLEVKDYAFDPTALDAFRYRVETALKTITGIAVREARTRELRQELIKSEKLKRHFEENPDDLHHLRHDGELRAAQIQSHLKHVPEYLMPGGLAQGNKVGQELGFVGFQKTSENRIRKKRQINRTKGRGKATARARGNPLKTFSARKK